MCAPGLDSSRQTRSMEEEEGFVFIWTAPHVLHKASFFPFHLLNKPSTSLGFFPR